MATLRRSEERGAARPLVLLLVLAIALRLLWVPFHLAVEEHHGIGLGRAQAPALAHTHADEGECSHEPHAAQDHESELFAGKPAPGLAVALAPAPGAPSLPGLEPANACEGRARDPVPRGRSPLARQARAPPSARG